MLNLNSHVYKDKCILTNHIKHIAGKAGKIVRMAGYSVMWMILFKVLLATTIVIVISSGMYKLLYYILEHIFVKHVCL